MEKVYIKIYKERFVLNSDLKFMFFICEKK